MDDYGTESDSDYTSYWRDWFISSRGNEYFCEIDEEYLTDRFNMTGLNIEVPYYQYALDLVTDVFDLDCDDEMRETIEKSARHLYGLVHARFIVTTRGLQKMLEKYKKADFGKCPRVMCNSHPLLPMGLSDVPNQKAVKLYCARCETRTTPNPPATPPSSEALKRRLRKMDVESGFREEEEEMDEDEESEEEEEEEGRGRAGACRSEEGQGQVA
ncbi:casein kinase 2 regulatory subunit [Collariella sp. IMI 366227]|nr:casein kinase 2 regulatory subunit [Collariella sp. IMI 366227]